MNGRSADPESGRTVGGAERATAKKTQANALFRKNLTFQKRNWRTNCCLVFFPIFLCVLLAVIQVIINNLLGNSFKCGCKDEPNSNGGPTPVQVCGIQYSTSDQAPFCGIANPTPWPAVLQVPGPQYRATQSDAYPDLAQNGSTCREAGTCAATIPYTGSNRTAADAMASYLLGNRGNISIFDPLYPLASVVVGSDTITYGNLLIESAFTSSQPTYILRPTCAGLNDFNVSFTAGAGYSFSQDFTCLETNSLWRGNASSVNAALYRGYRKGNPQGEFDEVPVAYDFGNTNPALFDVNIWYNDTYANRTGRGPSNLIRISRALNMATQAFLRLKAGPVTDLPLLFVKEMPKPDTQLRLDFSSLIGPLFYMWVLGFLFPIRNGHISLKTAQN